MKTFLSLLAISFFLSACIKKKTDCTDINFTHTFLEFANVDTSSNGGQGILIASPTQGDKLVFAYTAEGPGCDEIADDEFFEVLLFEVDPAANSFQYTSADLQQAMCYFRRVCYCSERSAVLPVGGTISGTRLSGNEWSVSINLTINGNRTLVNSATYRQQ